MSAPGPGDPLATQAHGPRLAGALDDARSGGFVGRSQELAEFAAALDGSSPVRVLYLHGPGGIGKTTLLDAFARSARGARHSAVYLDARDVECSASAVQTAIARRSAPDQAGLEQPAVLLIDGYELFAPLDHWFREELVASRPAGSVTVLAGRAAPTPSWRLDPGWRRLVTVRELTELDRTESVELLSRLGVAEPDRSVLTDLGRGHPLALAMLAEASRGGSAPTRLVDAPDVAATLCRLIVDDVPDAAHRTGLATCAHATRMTEDLLARTVGAQAGRVWRWLESRPYVRRGEIGLFLHDVVREVFEAEFAQRAPEAYTALHRAVRGYFLERIVDPAEPYPDRAAAEILLVHRRSPLSAQVSALRDGGVLSVPKATPSDHAEIVDLVARDNGSAAAQLMARWIAAQPGGMYVVRSDAGVEAFAQQVYLPAPPDLMADDPVVARVMAVVDSDGPLRPGERVNVSRFAGLLKADLRDPIWLLVNGVSSILEWANQPAAWTFILTPDPAHYGDYFEYLGLRRMADLDIAASPIAMFAWDRRRFSVAAFLDLMERRELSGDTGPPPPEMLRPPPLSRPDFDAAVRDALRVLNRTDLLCDSPLLGTALVDPAALDGAAALRAAMLGTIGTLHSERRGPELCRVLDRTYLRPAPSQEAAAQVLDLPFSTYRRHLAQATERLTDALWSVEIGTSRLSPAPEVSRN